LLREETTGQRRKECAPGEVFFDDAALRSLRSLSESMAFDWFLIRTGKNEAIKSDLRGGKLS
jgi:hypothetical protein